ncbi:MAG: FMN-binding negative transcriptional regulator [bacterium]
MYIPRHFAESDSTVLRSFVAAHPFGTLVTSGGGLFGTHLPLMLRDDVGALGTLEGHIARANEHWKRTPQGSEALVIFSGAQAYVTPTWYPSKEETGKVVPTWNYVAVHAYGTVRFVDDPHLIRSHLNRLTARHEAERGSRWAIEDAPADFVANQIRAIVGVEIEITRLEGKWKMSQNRSERDVTGVLAGLRDSGRPEDADIALIVASRNDQR